MNITYREFFDDFELRRYGDFHESSLHERVLWHLDCVATMNSISPAHSPRRRDYVYVAMRDFFAHRFVWVWYVVELVRYQLCAMKGHVWHILPYPDGNAESGQCKPLGYCTRCGAAM